MHTTAINEDEEPGTAWAVRGPRGADQRVELWTTRRTPFATDQSPGQKAMVKALEPILRSLECGPDERLDGVFTSDETQSRQPDAENICFYNFGARPFAGAGRSIGFERSYSAAPPSPIELRTTARYYHSWRIAPEDAGFMHWEAGMEVASWRDVPIELSGDLGLSIWRAIRENPGAVRVSGQLASDDHFGVFVTLFAPLATAPRIVEAMKGLVDGPIVGLQRADQLSAAAIARLMNRRWARPIDEAALLELVSSDRPEPVFPRPPFNTKGLDPCDELCVAGVARVESSSVSPTLSGSVVRMERR